MSKSVTQSKEWKALAAHAKALREASELGESDAAPSHRLSLSLNGFKADFTGASVSDKTLDLLVDLAKHQGFEEWRKRLFAGDKVNNTEGRAVMHMALRGDDADAYHVDGENVMPKLRDVLCRMEGFTEKVRSGAWKGHGGQEITDIVNIGIGGSDLGPYMVCEALEEYSGKLKTHFVSNVDAAHLEGVLGKVNPETTLFIITSKTFTTQETMMNAHTARRWLLDAYGGDEAAVAKHFVAVSTNKDAVKQFGIDVQNNMFEFWDWVGGRFSLWSAVGLSIALYIGFDNFSKMLKGAREMDQHFKTAPLHENIPALVGMFGVFHRNFMDCGSLAILPYAQRLNQLPAYLQQLEMESNGKSVTRDGRRTDYHTAPVIFGQAGTNGQHAFYQLLHQGTQIIPADITVIDKAMGDADHHKVLCAHARAQIRAFDEGQTVAQAKSKLEVKEAFSKESADDNTAHLNLLSQHGVFDGGRPVQVFTMPELSPEYVGMLLAMYEHKVFTQGVLWELNSFDQWGVQLGKDLAAEILNAEGKAQGRAPKTGIK